MQCGCSGCGHGWSCDLVGGVHPASPLLTLQYQRAMSGRGRGGRWGGFQCTSLFALASKKDFHSMLVCVWVCKWVCLRLPLFSHLPGLCLRCWGEKEVGRCHSNSVTVQWWLVAQWRDVVFVQSEPSAVWWGWKWVWESWTRLQRHRRNQSGLIIPILRHPGPGRQPDQCLFIMSLCSLLLIVLGAGWPLWSFKRLGRGDVSTQTAGLTRTDPTIWTLGLCRFSSYQVVETEHVMIGSVTD